MLRFVLLLGLLNLMSSCKSAGDTRSQAGAEARETLTIYVVRHAEKEAGDDPQLTPAGQERAHKLAARLAKVKLDAIFSTDFQRTRLTAQPVAARQGLAIQIYAPGDLPAFAAQLQREYAGKNVLVVGHSNSTPTLAGLLDGTNAYPAFAESEYGNIIQVTCSGKATPVVEFMAY